MSVLKFVIIIPLLISHVSAFNILAIISLPLRSHYMAFHPFFVQLAKKGHNVTVMNNYPDEKSTPNLKFVDLKSQPVVSLPPMEVYEATDFSYLPLMDVFRQVLYTPVATRINCENLFKTKKANGSGVEYDVIFVELFGSDCELAYAATLYNAPIIGIKSHVLLPTAYSRLGITFDVAADSFYFSAAGTNPSLIHKVQNFIVNFMLNTIATWFTQRTVYEILNRHIPNNTLSIEQAAKERIKMVFAYQHFSVTGARLLAPQLLEIGGIHVGTPKAVPIEIEKFLSDANNGAIYVGFGSNLKPGTMSKSKLQHFLTAFKRLPYKVIWKLENVTLPTGYEKIYTSSWLPQLDILCHPKVLAFVSHGGMLSLSETAHCGKPVLTIPFFGDQFTNAAALREVGLGKTLNFDKLNADNLEETIKVLTSQEMQQNAQRISRQWHDRPQPVMDSAIYWTEYVARHRNAPGSLPSKHNTWFQSSLIDVYIVVFGILLAIFSLIYLLLKLLKLCLLAFIGIIVCKNKPKLE